MKKVRTIRIDKEVSDNLDSICTRHGDVSWHIEQALNGYGPIKALDVKSGAKPDIKVPALHDDDHEFEQIWELYERKGNKKTSRARFAKLSREVRECIYNHLPAYLASTPDKKYRKDFQSYLNLECWNDEVITNGQQNRPNGNPKPNKLTPIERVRAKRRAAEESRGRVEPMGADDPSVPVHLDRSGGGRADGDLGSVIDGDYTRTS